MRYPLSEDEKGEKFGYYLNTEIVEEYWKVGSPPLETDNKSFEFNLQSNGRLEKPMKFEIKELKEGGYKLFKPSDNRLISLGDIALNKANRKNQSKCSQNEEYFDYHRIENALYGKTKYENFTSKRILVIQMK